MTELAHILIVDDDPSIRRMLQLLLRDTGYRVSTATSGEEALAYLDLVTPDLILMDLMLPGISGDEAIRRIKSDPARPFIPIILVTARGDQRSKVAGLDAGADDFLVKPLELAELLARLRAMLRLQRSQRSLQNEQRKTELLLHLTRELGTTLDLDQLLTHFLQRLADAVGAVRASIILVGSTAPRCYSSHGLLSTTIDHILRDGIAGQVLRERRPVVIEDTQNDARWLPFTGNETVRSAAAVPIIREGRVHGTITLVHHTPSHFTDTHIDLLNSVAAQCAITLENAALFELTRQQNELLERRAEELQRINQISQHLTELMRPEQLLRLVAHLVHYTFGYPIVAILLHDGDDLVVRAVAGRLGTEQLMGLRQPYNQGLPGWVAVHQEPVCVSDLLADPRFVGVPGFEEVRSGLVVPILTAREVFGVMAVTSEVVNAFGPNDMRLLDTLARQLGVAMDNARLFDTETRRVRQLGLVNGLSVALTAQVDAVEHLRLAADTFASVFESPRCALLMRAKTAREHIWTVSSNTTLHTPPEQFDQLLRSRQVPLALKLRRPQLVISVLADERFEPFWPMLAREGIEALALAPLFSAGRWTGTVVIDITGQVDRFGHAELTLLETMSSLVAQVMENARLYRQVADERSTLNAVLDGAADPILLISPQNRLLLANRAAETHLGIGATGQPVERAIDNTQLLDALDKPGLTIPAANEVTLPDHKTFSISIAPVNGANNEQIGRVAVLQDISAIKELERREQERLHSVFRRYVSPQVAEQVLAGGGDFGAPVERNVAVLFADLRGYTALTEGIDPQVLVEQVLNRYFTAMTDVLYRYEGTIDKFLGDGIIGVFGTPLAHDDDLQRALHTAVDLQAAFGALRQLWQCELGLDIGMGIGIDYGRAVIGNIGSSQRLDYTLIGDVVNTASRLSGLAQPGQIIVSYHLIEALPPGWHAPWTLRPIGPARLKGKQAPHMIYEIGYAEAVAACGAPAAGAIKRR